MTITQATQTGSARAVQAAVLRYDTSPVGRRNRQQQRNQRRALVRLLVAVRGGRTMSGNQTLAEQLAELDRQILAAQRELQEAGLRMRQLQKTRDQVMKRIDAGEVKRDA
jgi:Na+-transporting NADH:ubiquinone oxidoreductase subunit NqrA